MIVDDIRRPIVLSAALLLVGCASGARPETTPRPDSGRPTLPEIGIPNGDVGDHETSLPPSEAFRRGLMPLASTRVDDYLRADPSSDGRGVLIAILDGGIDPGVAGLSITTTGEAKLVDLRDFSGEGWIELAPIQLRGDSATIGSSTLTGFKKWADLAGAANLYGGVLIERRLGEMPASDVNGDGDETDALPVVVLRGSQGWVLVADTDEDGSLTNERPIHDYLVARETFGWAGRGKTAPLMMAVNLTPRPEGPPRLDLFFDNSGHGTHVAGIAAGADLYGVEGFHGVAPGAQLLGLKISNDALGGISVTAGMIRALDYAIRFAELRRQPLVVNLSFGVGNEREGTARIDALIDSILAAHPRVILATSAGNDGPGISTVGFPGSAERVISVGATYPPSFIGSPDVKHDVIAFFSARGGELAKPDLLAPGMAFSSVPRWDVGSEYKSGTSMASPHVAGVVALLLSKAVAERREWSAAQIKRALKGTAVPIEGAMFVDQGAGLLDVVAADSGLRGVAPDAAVEITIKGTRTGGILAVTSGGRLRDSIVEVTIGGAPQGPIALECPADWVTVPPTVDHGLPNVSFPVKLRADRVPGGSAVEAVITGWARDRAAGPLFRIPVTVVTPTDIPDSGRTLRYRVRPAGIVRLFLPADSVRAFQVTVTTSQVDQHVLTFLHGPGGKPVANESAKPAGAGEQAARFDIDAREVLGGLYELDIVAPPTDSADVTVTVQRAPVRIAAKRLIGDTVVASISNLVDDVVAGTVLFGLIGAERHVRFTQRGPAERRIGFEVPGWARRVVVALELPKDQWPLFTDLGLSLLDEEGRLVANAPLNYAEGRLTLELDSLAAGRTLDVVISPGLAELADTPWEGMLAIRFYAESPVLIEPLESAGVSLSPKERIEIRWRLPAASPLTLGDGFFPVGTVVVELPRGLWGRETPLPEALPPLMR